MGFENPHKTITDLRLGNKHLQLEVERLEELIRVLRAEKEDMKARNRQLRLDRLDHWNRYHRGQK